MRVLFSATLVLSFSCGDSTIELRGQSAPLSKSEVTVVRDAGTPPPAGGGSGEILEGPGVDAGTTGGGGGSQAGGEGLDAGPGAECEPTQTRACSTSCGSTGVQRCAEGAWQTCERPREVCSNGLDDDCDGAIDGRDRDCPPTLVRCESTEGNTCNDDLGYGDRCAPQWNTGGCSAERFANWCNRRNPSTPDRWDDYIAAWVDARCDGTLEVDGATFRCLTSTNTQYECTTPLVLVFDAASALPLSPTTRRFAFTPGEVVRTAWPRPETPWLVRDLNHNGRVDDGAELFGSSTRIDGGRLAADGFQALAALDANHDGVVDARDPAFAELRLWTGVGLASGVPALKVKAEPYVRCDERGNCERGRSRFPGGVVVDLYLRVER